MAQVKNWRKGEIIYRPLSYACIPGPCYANQCLNPTHLNLCIILVLPPTKTDMSVSSAATTSQLYLLCMMRTISKSKNFWQLLSMNLQFEFKLMQFR